MYSVYADNVCVFDDRFDSEKLNACNVVLTLEDSAAGSLEFTIPPDNPGYSVIERMTTEIVVKKDENEIWSGRVLSESMDFLNRRTLCCEGELAYLNDSIQPQREYHDLTVRGYLEKIIAFHNARVDDDETLDKRFVVGAVTVEDNNESSYRYTDYENTMAYINDLIGKLGGHIRIRKEDGFRYIDYLKDYPNTNSQVIRFGENLLDFAKSYDLSELATVIIPLGKALDTDTATSTETTDSTKEELQKYLTVESVNNHSIYVASQVAVERFGWIEKVVRWEDIDSPSELLKKAERYLTATQFEEMQLDVSAVDLSYIDVDSDYIQLLDEIRVVSEPHGLDKLFPVRKITIPLDKPEESKLELGSKVKTSLTAVNNSVNSEIIKRIENIPPPSSFLQSAKDNASQLIRSATNGYVTIVNDNDQTQEILISNLPDYKTATKIWRWNINGLGYSSTGYNGEYGLAMTMDGAIVADRVTAGTMYADRIKGGTLTLGGVDNESGILIVKNQNGEFSCQIDKSGMKTVSGDNYWIKLENGEIRGGQAEDCYAIINTSTYINDLASNVQRRGLTLKSDGMILACNMLATIDNLDDDAVSLIGGTGTVNIVTEITPSADGGISWTTTPYQFVNGILVSTL